MTLNGKHENPDPAVPENPQVVGMNITRARRPRRPVAVFLLLAIAAGGALYIGPVLKGMFMPATANKGFHATKGRILYWQDPMHPQYRSDKPGKAPDCGMDLVPVYEVDSEAAEGLPEAAFRITPEKQQLIGVQYGEVTRQPFATTIRAVGRLVYDETRIARVHSKTAGWIERVFVDFTGKLVEKGQPLVSVYSPELLATQEEYLLALRAQLRLGGSRFKEVAAGAESLLEAARSRLELWDISEEQIAELERTKKPVKALTYHSPVGGFVVTRNAYDRQRIMPETELYSIADLSTIWVIADIYEFEAPEVRVGQPATVKLSYSRGPDFRGKVTYIYPQLDAATRTLKVRVELPNPDFTLKPDMYADVELRLDHGRQLSVPAEAVLDSGAEQLVFVGLEQGYFEPRKVQLGAKIGDRFVVLGGLKEGERIVTSGNFLIDSESKLKSAASGMGMPGMDHSGGQGGTSKASAAKAAASGKPSPQSTPEDHSQHQPKRRQE